MSGCVLKVGTVTAVDTGKLIARARFDEMRDKDCNPMISDWLQVVQRTGTELDIAPDGKHSRGGASEALVPDHRHPKSMGGVWMPKVNDQVLVLFDGVANGRGYILGGVIPWR